MEKNNFIGYEYQDVTVKRSMASLYADSYQNFGWELDGTAEPVDKLDSVTMKFKRDRKLRNKAELTRLQRNFDACITEILSLEAQKYIKASVVAYIIGIIGTAFMAGSVFAVTANRIIPCILLAIPAFIGWVLPYFCYHTIVKKKAAEVTPLIDQKYEEVYAVCEKANALLDG
jgi:hypothetical protein